MLDLGSVRRVLRVEADVTHAGRLNEVWDFIEVFTSNDNYIWQPFGIKGKKDGIPDILEEENYIARPLPVSAQFIKVSDARNISAGRMQDELFSCGGSDPNTMLQSVSGTTTLTRMHRFPSDQRS